MKQIYGKFFNLPNFLIKIFQKLDQRLVFGDELTNGSFSVTNRIYF